MLAATSCPDVNVLRRFRVGDLPEAEAEGLLPHLAQCGPCTQTLQGLGGGDTLLDALRKASAETVEEPWKEEVQGLIERLRKLPELAATGAAPSPGKELYDFLAPAQAADELGRLGPYRVLRVLGAGGMGVVFEAEDTQLKRKAALKAMLPALAASSGARQRFLREAQLAAAVEHEHIVTIYQVGEDRGVPFLAMQLLKGLSLEGWLREFGSPLPPAQVLRLGREIAQGLAAAHASGLIHRDIKPSNIWLEEGTVRVKLLDFGLARAAADETGLTAPGVVVGTPAFMSPEQANSLPLDARSDLFSLGSVLYLLCTGRPPFAGEGLLGTLRAVISEQPRTPSEVNPEVPLALSDLVMRLLAKNPDARYPSAAAVSAALREIESGLRPALPTPQPIEAPPPRRRRTLVLAAAGLVGTLALAAAVILSIKGDGWEGTVVIDSDDPDVEVRVTQGGKEIRILDSRTGEEARLKPGTYEVELTRGKDRLKLVTREFTLKRGDREIARIRVERPVAAPARQDAVRREAEWVSLFNGKDLTGWESEHGKEKFSVDADGNLVAAGDTPAGPRWLLTEKDYADFVLRLDFQFAIPRMMNSGVTIRSLPGLTGANRLKLEVQLRTHAILPYTGAVCFGGAAVNAVSPKRAPLVKPSGDWNTLEVEAVGTRLKVTVNGQLVNDVDLSRVDRSKLHPKEKGAAVANLERKSGRIGLQSLNAPMKFRNIRIQER